MGQPSINISQLIHCHRFVKLDALLNELSLPESVVTLHRERSEYSLSKMNKKAQFEFWVVKVEGLEEILETVSDEEKAELLCAKSQILLEIGEIYNYFEDERAEKTFEDAVKCAFESQKEFSIYSALNGLGRFYSQKDRIPEAITCLQAAVLFTRCMWPGVFLSSIQNLAYHWGRQDETLPLSEAMYDWLSVMSPDRLDFRIGKYKQLIQQGRRNEVIEESQQVEWDDIFSVTRYIAANWALRRKKRAHTAVQRVLSDESGLFGREFKYSLKLSFPEIEAAKNKVQ